MFHFVDEPSLEFFFGLQTVFFHACLAVRALLPVGLFYFITADVYVFIREEFDELSVNILAEFKGRILTRTYRRREGRSPTGFFETGYSVVVADGCKHVARHIEFRNDVDAANLGISNHFLHVFLGVETTIKGITFHHLNLVGRNFIIRIVLLGCILDTVTVVVVEFSPSALFGKERVLLDFESPTLVVGQVPVEFVELIECHEVKEFHDFFLGVEVTGNVEHQATPTETRCVLNLNGRDAPTHVYLAVRFDFSREELTEGLDTGDNASVGITGDDYLSRR